MHEIDKQKFGAFVSQLRRERGLTQKDLAEQLFISDKAVSKWETGVSIPDVAVLIPLSEALGVTVTELLQAQRLEAPLNPGQVEDLVKQAISYTPTREKLQMHWKHLPAYLICLGIGLTETALMQVLGLEGYMTEMLLLVLILCPIFGGYFMLAAMERLPDYYDQNYITSLGDGFLRLNLPGVRFTNGNWPYIVRSGRIWYMAMVTGYPALHLAGLLFAPALWHSCEPAICLILILGGLFIPMITVARKHELV